MVILDRLKVEIHNKSLEIKKKIKELNLILSNLYNRERSLKNNNIYHLKRNAEKVSSAVKKLDNLDIRNLEENKSNDKRSSENEILKLHKNTLDNIKKLENIYKSKLSKDVWAGESQEVKRLKRDIDLLRLAYEDLRRLSPEYDLKLNKKNNLDDFL